MSYKMKSPSREYDPDQPTGLREKLWQLHVRVVERVLERIQEPTVKPIWISLSIALLRLNDIRVSRTQQAVMGGLQRLGNLAASINAPFLPSIVEKQKDDE